MTIASDQLSKFEAQEGELNPVETLEVDAILLRKASAVVTRNEKWCRSIGASVFDLQGKSLKIDIWEGSEEAVLLSNVNNTSSRDCE